MPSLYGEKWELGKTVSSSTLSYETGKLFVSVLVTGVPKSCLQKWLSTDLKNKLVQPFMSSAKSVSGVSPAEQSSPHRVCTETRLLGFNFHKKTAVSHAQSWFRDYWKVTCLNPEEMSSYLYVIGTKSLSKTGGYLHPVSQGRESFCPGFALCNTFAVYWLHSPLFLAISWHSFSEGHVGTTTYFSCLP